MRLNGALNLSRIPRELIRTNKNGDKILYVNVDENFRGVDQYGYTHNITVYDKEHNKNIYLANLKPVEPREKQEQSKAQGQESDLPF